MQGFINGDYDRVELVYNHFRNAAIQYQVAEQLLPVPKPEAKKEEQFKLKEAKILKRS
jgi:F-type H+-transporting ATPase subunit gamma